MSGNVISDYQIWQRRPLTDLIQHLVALIENEVLDVSQRQSFVSDKSIETTWSSNNDIGVLLFVFQQFEVLCHWSTTIKDSSLHLRKVLAKSSVLVLNLICQLSSVAHYEDRAFSRYWLQGVEGSKDEDGGLTQTRLCLAKDVGVE